MFLRLAENFVSPYSEALYSRRPLSVNVLMLMTITTTRSSARNDRCDYRRQLFSAASNAGGIQRSSSMFQWITSTPGPLMIIIEFSIALRNIIRERTNTAYKMDRSHISDASSLDCGHTEVSITRRILRTFLLLTVLRWT